MGLSVTSSRGCTLGFFQTASRLVAIGLHLIGICLYTYNDASRRDPFRCDHLFQQSWMSMLRKTHNSALTLIRLGRRCMASRDLEVPLPVISVPKELSCKRARTLLHSAERVGLIPSELFFSSWRLRKKVGRTQHCCYCS